MSVRRPAGEEPAQRQGSTRRRHRRAVVSPKPAPRTEACRQRLAHRAASEAADRDGAKAHHVQRRAQPLLEPDALARLAQIDGERKVAALAAASGRQLSPVAGRVRELEDVVSRTTLVRSGSHAPTSKRPTFSSRVDGRIVTVHRPRHS